MMHAVRPIAALLLLGAAGCARDTNVYPSLAPRTAEQRGFAEPETPPPTPVATDPALDAQIATLRQRLSEVTAGFDRAAASARAAAGRSSARTVGGDAWLEAQTLLAQLDDWRAQASSLTSDADGYASARAATLAPPYPALEAIRVTVAAEVARQDAVITAIAASLPTA